MQYLCQHVLYFCGPLALWGLCAHLYEHPPTNPTLSSIWAPTVGRIPPNPNLNPNRQLLWICCPVLCNATNPNPNSVRQLNSNELTLRFDPEFNPDKGLTVSNMVLCAPHVIDGLRRCVAAPGAMQGEAP